VCCDEVLVRWHYWSGNTVGSSAGTVPFLHMIHLSFNVTIVSASMRRGADGIGARA